MNISRIAGKAAAAEAPLGTSPTGLSIKSNHTSLNHGQSVTLSSVLSGANESSPVSVTQTVPVYQVLFPGGDTQVVTNAEYRIPIVGPVTLAFFGDAGVNKLSMLNQLRMNPSHIDLLNGSFPQAAFSNQAVVAPGTQKVRASTGIERPSSLLAQPAK